MNLSELIKAHGIKDKYFRKIPSGFVVLHTSTSTCFVHKVSPMGELIYLSRRELLIGDILFENWEIFKE